MRYIVITLLAVVILVGCNQSKTINKKPVVFDLSDRDTRMNFDFEKYDTVYTNLLNTATNDAEGDSLFNLWVEYRKKLESVIKENHFDWETTDSSIILWDRVYCTSKGEVEYYLYYVLDTAFQNTISEERRFAYGDFIKEQLPQLKYPLTRDYKYAQCGTIRYHIY